MNEFNSRSNLWDFCMKVRKRKLEDRADFELTSFINPKPLLKFAKEHSLSYDEDVRKMDSVDNDFNN